MSAEERLKSRKKIQTLFAEGKVLNNPPIRVVYQWQKDDSLLQFGVAAGTRYFKKAVDRNRIKRLIREAYRLQKNELKECLNAQQKGLSLFIMYTGKTIPEYHFIYERIGGILKKIAMESDASA